MHCRQRHCFDLSGLFSAVGSISDYTYVQFLRLNKTIHICIITTKICYVFGLLYIKIALQT